LQTLADEYGLNLTFGTLSAACKYIPPSNHAGRGSNRSHKKPGFFASENALIDSIREKTGTGAARNPITYLVEAADDIVYSVADIEDAVKKGVLTWDEVERLIRDESGRGVPSEIVDDLLERKDRILKAGRDNVPDNLPGDIHAAALRTAAVAISLEAAATTFECRYRQIMDGLYESDLASDCRTTPLIDLFKRIGQQRIYCTHATIKLELMGRCVIQDLMDLFWEGAQVLPTDRAPRTKDFPGRIGALLSENYRTAFQHSVQDPTSDLPEDYYIFQLVTDYICGMTDSFAKRLHAELTNG
jgi:dGTPase